MELKSNTFILSDHYRLNAQCYLLTRVCVCGTEVAVYHVLSSLLLPVVFLTCTHVPILNKHACQHDGT